VTSALYKDQAGGAAIWLETQNVSLDEYGRYTVLLGATKSDGLPMELFTSGEARLCGAFPSFHQDTQLQSQIDDLGSVVRRTTHTCWLTDGTSSLPGIARSQS